MPKVSAAGGPALKAAIHVARARAGIPSDLQLALNAGVSYDTLMNWYRGSTVPRPAQILKIAKVLDVSMDTLLGAYEGREAEPDSVTEALRAHTAAVERQNELLSSLVAALTAGALGVGRALAGPGTEDRLAALAQVATTADPPTTGGVGEQARPGEADTETPPRGRRA